MREALARLEAGLALTLAWLLVFGLPFRHTSRMFGRLSLPSTGADTHSSSELARSRAVIRRLGRVADRLPWSSTCLVRALAGRLLLERRGLSGVVIRLGVNRSDGRISAHAWLLLGTAVLAGGEGVPGFQPVADLARS